MNTLNREMVVEWTEEKYLHLTFDANDKSTFESAAWNR